MNYFGFDYYYFLCRMDFHGPFLPYHHGYHGLYRGRQLRLEEYLWWGWCQTEVC